MKHNYSWTKLLFYVSGVIFFVLLSIPLIQSEEYNITKVTGRIIREELFEAYLYNEIWTTIHYINLKDLSSDLIQLQLHLDKMREKF